MANGMPDSELAAPVVLTLYLDLRMASMAATAELLPAEPVTPMMIGLI